MEAQNQNRSARGFELLKQVYGELYHQFGEDYSAEELLKAAQVLIGVTREEYVSEGYEDMQSYSGYFSRDTDYMILHQSWRILEVEIKLYSVQMDWE
ncbi:MAG: hypothetical protein ACOYO0_03020 [Sandarakinorhabdus sp.]